MGGRLLSCWEDNFSGAMLNFGRVIFKHFETDMAGIQLSIVSLPDLHRFVAKPPGSSNAA